MYVYVVDHVYIYMNTGCDVYHDKITQYSRFKVTEVTARDMIPSYHTYIDTYL